MRESYKRFVKTWIRFANPDSEGHESGFVTRESGFANPNPSSFQKIRFVDSFRDALFIRFVSWIRFVTQFS
jgi:hypothetical protein